jgi:uncharacterized protein YgbK (DUF1537 family)
VEQCYVFADDATGALEAGALLAEAGVKALVRLRPDDAARDDRLTSVVLLATRHETAERAREMVRVAAAGVAGAAIYWKTDSTLRGPIGACFEALLDALPGRAVVYAPAYPALGRTCRNGVLRVHGVEVEESEFGRDALNPVRTSSVVETVAGRGRCAVSRAADARELTELLRRGAAGVIVCDAETEEEAEALMEVCAAERRRLVAAGPAGGIRYWARRLPGAVSGISAKWPEAGKWLVVCGSRHAVSRAQAEAARRLGLEVIAEGEADRLAAVAAESTARGMMIFGGDTALAVWRALGIETLEPLGEALPGVAVSRAGGRVFVTKAGGFGEPDLAERVLERWKR